MNLPVNSLTSLSFYWVSVVTVSIFKMLFLKSYHSTDFEVHRNWMAITHNLNISDWYYDETSQWTLDYPPLFAYFEWMWSQLALVFDPKMLLIDNINYASPQTILFQKLTVVLSDLVLAFGILKCADAGNNMLPKRLTSRFRMKLLVLIFMNGALVIVDHIHFQYNGFLFGILLLSISQALNDNGYQSAFLFACLLNFKHIFLYMAPAIGVHLFRLYCCDFQRNTSMPSLRIKNLLAFLLIGLTVFLGSFGPFYSHIPQILKRLFPFQRGLCHAYWAPNIWAVYSLLDLSSNFVLKKGNSSLASGLVQEHLLNVLPQIKPWYTLVLTVVFMLPCLYKIWNRPTAANLVFGIVLNAWTSFLFGYHVHEKAILNVLVPFSLVATLEPSLFLLTLITGTFSVFPLLFTPFEIVLKLLIGVFHVLLSSIVLPTRYAWYEKAYIFGFLPLFIVENTGLLFRKFPFVPLILVSTYCFVGLFYCYLRVYRNYMLDCLGTFKADTTSSIALRVRKRKRHSS